MGGSAKMAAIRMLVCCNSYDDEKLQRSRSRAIDKQIKTEKIHYRRTVKILLLGSGESGKSTFLKQMRIIHGQEFGEEDILQYKTVIYGNVLKGMKVLIDARDKLCINWENKDNSTYADKIWAFDNSIHLEESVFRHYVTDLSVLWNDGGIKRAFDRRREFQLGDSIKYFLDNLERIGHQNYIPTRLDILHSRKATQGIYELEFDIRGIPFRFIDVGGQRSQRQKWYQCFEGVTSILFLVSSSEFDQVLFEDRRTNRLTESCNIFETIVNNKAFVNVSIILFLNKTDLLEEKIKVVNIKNYFSEFTGDPSKLEDVQGFELAMLDSQRRERTRPLFHHFTTAIDTENIRFVFQAVKDTILQDNLRSLMLQ